MMKFYKLNIKEIIYGLVLIALGWLYIRFDQLIIPEKIRFVFFLGIIIAGFLIYFIILRPGKPFRLSNTLSVFTGAISAILIIIQHIIITCDISAKVFLIFISSVLMPYLSGAVYYFVFNSKTRRL